MKHWEIEELACLMLNLPEGSEGIDIQHKLYEDMDVSFEQFEDVVTALLPFTPKVVTAITETEKHAFVKDGVIICSIES